MEELKSNVFNVVAGSLSINKFENWLYSNEYVIEQIEKDSLIYDLITINYKDDKAASLLKEIAFKLFNYDEYVIMIIESKCKLILDVNDWEEIKKTFREILVFFNYETDYFLLWEVYNANEQLELLELGYETETNVKKMIKNLAKNIYFKSQSIETYEGKAQFLLNGFKKEQSESKSLSETIVEYHIGTKTVEPKKWYEFWK